MDQKKMVQFLSFWVVNTVVLLVSSFIFGGNVVLGNDKVSMPMAAVISGLIITLAGLAVDPLVKRWGLVENLKSTLKATGLKMKDDALWGIIYLVFNIIVVWIIKRFALLIGLGVASIMYVFIVGILLTVAQWGAAIVNGAAKNPSK